jgi:hypothetical protein
LHLEQLLLAIAARLAKSWQDRGGRVWPDARRGGVWPRPDVLQHSCNTAATQLQHGHGQTWPRRVWPRRVDTPDTPRASGVSKSAPTPAHRLRPPIPHRPTRTPAPHAPGLPSRSLTRTGCVPARSVRPRRRNKAATRRGAPPLPFPPRPRRARLRMRGGAWACAGRRPARRTRAASRVNRAARCGRLVGRADGRTGRETGTCREPLRPAFPRPVALCARPRFSSPPRRSPVRPERRRRRWRQRRRELRRAGAWERRLAGEACARP